MILNCFDTAEKINPAFNSQSLSKNTQRLSKNTGILQSSGYTSLLLIQAGLSESLAGRFFLHHSSADYTITYWRYKDREVDFVITRGAKLWAVEVKSGRGGKTPGLESFRARYQDARILVVGDQGIPLQEFFDTPAEVWLGG